ncbi:MAG: peptide deformylase [Candidatus Eiseniibacteriota bacterium]
MAVRPIRIYGDPVLREKARPVERVDAEVRRLAEDLLETLADAEGVGLAAPQVGASQRIIVVHPAGEDGQPREPPRVLVNPDVVDRGGAQVGAEEGCLSIPGIYDTVKRPDRVRVRALDLDGHEVEIDADGMLARILQHEIDHLDGVLFIDRVGPMRRALLGRRLRELQG